MRRRGSDLATLSWWRRGRRERWWDLARLSSERSEVWEVWEEEREERGLAAGSGKRSEGLQLGIRVWGSASA